MAKVYDERVKAVNVWAGLNDFDGSVDEWKMKFYELWRYQMTFSFAYEIDVHEVSSGDVIVDLIVKSEFKQNILDTMESLGYRNIHTDDEYIGIVYAFEHDELDDIWHLYLDD